MRYSLLPVTRTVGAITLAAGVSVALFGQQQTFAVGVVDLYGLRHVSARDVRQALTVHVGDTVTWGDAPPVFIAESQLRLRAVPGVVDAKLEVVCCDDARVLVYVGIAEKGSPEVHLRPRPHGAVRLADEIVQAGDDFDVALAGAMARDDFEEDDSQGHALFHDPAVRAVQERFLALAAVRLPELRRVLRESSDDDQRALAAQIIGYAPRKREVVSDLVAAMTDPGDAVRNNAMRALAVIAGAASTMPEKGVRVPFEPFVALLDSLTWTDRNKASLALWDLTESRPTAWLAALRRQAMPALVEMARWTSEGHAMPAFAILGRMVGIPEDDLEAAWKTDREAVIAAALKGP
jgi:hypothetical protein